MPDRNRVTPGGEIVAIAQRGLFLGNRGSIHRGREIVRPWQVRRWITCTLTYKDWVAPKWEPGRWTPLFFLDEAVALAAGHRPCSLCRHGDFVRWMDAWERATGSRPRVDPMDRQLHEERVDGARTQQTHRVPWSDLPTGAFVLLDDAPALVVGDRALPWTPTAAGYEQPRRARRRGTPPSSRPRRRSPCSATGMSPSSTPPHSGRDGRGAEISARRVGRSRSGSRSGPARGPGSRRGR